MWERLKQASVLGLPVHLSEDYVGWLQRRIESGLYTHVVTLNSEMAMMAEKSHDLADIIRQAELVIPDGAGVIFYLRLHAARQQRCPGIELAATLLEQLNDCQSNHPIVFYGGKPGISDRAAQFWREKCPNLTLFAAHGYLSVSEEQQFCQLLKTQQPRLILVGLGVPRQENWILQHRALCPQATWIGVGGSFDIWSGTKERAPTWFCNNNLEWLYRLYQEPWRWRRMLVLPQFALRTLAAVAKPSVN
ncbi:MAG: WecB/TagA/CpsF family glycosyltransferase [Jaaginema sp. PMC 1079.18]|nr:WecB/TagA/CpsF family glycosyltransferase [Jaaginema sp. PMC 1080.18]MEC4849394.1 WecB/TagA/CpsF family glycosyltransferase [Jaaginema sp. PMC 1079.18]MEC4865427.1 WecB/TagA/CpsF family glycosyltransferase [Jaaginema sp. PMC 1078.18]